MSDMEMKDNDYQCDDKFNTDDTELWEILMAGASTVSLVQVSF